ncbi:MAG: rhodanese-related sulfurtransferase [Cyanobacteria bacterium REEB459]|nr:rhodanese-related sulfurtransferase [Cyanobacteria bacterium REEB459]
MTFASNPLPYSDLSVEHLGQYLAAPQGNWQLIDVREPEELALASLPGFTNLPLSQFARWSETMAGQFQAQQPTVVLCHHGRRSAQMCLWLAQQGFTQLHNVAGGIDAYALVVDPSVPRY